MKRVGLKLPRLIAVVFFLHSVVARSSDSNTDATVQSSSALTTNVAQLRALSRADLNRGRPISVTGTVTLVDNDKKRLVLEDATGAVVWYSDKPMDAALAGKKIRINCPNAFIYATTFPDFPNLPSGADIQGSFIAPSNWGDYHLTRMAAHLHPPKSGEYRFWIASDDSSELWLSADEYPTHVKKIASVMEGFWTDPNEWDRFPFQRSESIYLQSDKSYYIEAYQDQGLVNDHLSVAWQGPGVERSVISAQYLTPWTGGQSALVKNGRDVTNGVLREYWTNFTVGAVTPVTPDGSADVPLTGTDATFEVIGAGDQREPLLVNLSGPLLPENNFRRIQTEGTITFVSTSGTGATLELAAGSRRALVHVPKWNDDRAQSGQHWHARVRGVCEGATDDYSELNIGYIWGSAAEDVQLLEVESEQTESVLRSGSTTDSGASFGGYYSARGAVMFDGRFAGRRYLYVQDINGSVCVSDVDRVEKNPLEVGERIQVGGTLSPGKVGWQLVPMSIRVLGVQSLPLPAEISGDAAYRDGQWTEVEGIVRSIGAEGELKVKAAGGLVSVWCPALSGERSLVDCALRVRGVISLYAQEGPVLLVASHQFVQIEERGAQDPFALATCRIRDLDDFRCGTALVHRVKVEGTVTYAKEKTIFLQDSSGAVRLSIDGTTSVHLGDRLEAVGFPDTNSSIRVLAEPELRGQSVGPTVSASDLDLNQVFSQDANGTLVEVSGTLLGQKNQGSVRVLELQSGQHVFEAVLAFKDNHLPPLAINSSLKVTGICLADFISSPEAKLASLENASMSSMQILLRAPTDIIVQRGPPWWTPVKMVALVGFLLAVLGGTFLWMHLLGRRYERRQMAQLEFSRQILQSQEAERRRIAANLHDGLGQNLLVIKNQVRLAMQPTLDRDDLSKRLDEISGMASQVIAEVRQVTHDLRPYQLERVGLTQSLRRSIQQASESSPIVFASDVDDVDGLFDNDGEIHIYRILQEALNNVVKHSGATEATALVRREASSVFVAVRDNGRGIASDVANGTELPQAGFGLSGIEERARILRGKALFDSSPGQGFRLSVEIPLPLKV